MSTQTVRIHNPQPTTRRPMKRDSKGRFIKRTRRTRRAPARRTYRRRRNPTMPIARRRRATGRRRRAYRRRRAAPVRTYRRRSNPARKRTYRRRSNPQRLTGRAMWREAQHLAVAGVAGGAATWAVEWGISQLKGWAVRNQILEGLTGGDTVRAGRLAEYGGDILQIVAAAGYGVWSKGRVRQAAIRNGITYGLGVSAVARMIRRVVAQMQAQQAPQPQPQPQPEQPTLVGYSRPRGNLGDTFYMSQNFDPSWPSNLQASNLQGQMYVGGQQVGGATADELAQTDY